MSHRRDRLAHVVRDVVSDAIANRVSDPRVKEMTSVTRVEMSADLKIAAVYVSVMGTETEARTTLRGLHSARGMIQTRLARTLNIRQCPSIQFHLDPGIKRALATIRRIDALGAEARDGQPLADDGEAESGGPSNPGAQTPSSECEDRE
ncbi:MAG: 30S ribosome-binding factor RbfA [Phycisphaerae bacterium]